MRNTLPNPRPQCNVRRPSANKRTYGVGAHLALVNCGLIGGGARPHQQRVCGAPQVDPSSLYIPPQWGAGRPGLPRADTHPGVCAPERSATPSVVSGEPAAPVTLPAALRAPHPRPNFWAIFISEKFGPISEYSGPISCSKLLGWARSVDATPSCLLPRGKKAHKKRALSTRPSFWRGGSPPPPPHTMPIVGHAGNAWFLYPRLITDV